MKSVFSIITVTLNSEQTISSTLISVRDQKGVTVEHIIKDAVSCDNTLALAKQINPDCKILSCPDKGIYDAMNQGFQESTGEFVAFLNSDDHYASDEILSDVAERFISTNCDFVYGDIQMVNDAGAVVRDWRCGELSDGRLRSSQLPHPGLFVRRSWLERINGPFDGSYRISADLKQQLYLINKLGARGEYLAKPVVIMALGGTSTAGVKSYLKGWVESRRAWNEVHDHGGTAYVVRKVFSKLEQVRI